MVTLAILENCIHEEVLNAVCIEVETARAEQRQRDAEIAKRVGSSMNMDAADAGEAIATAIMSQGNTEYAQWFDSTHKPTECGLYYWETCDDFGNPRPGLYFWGEGNPPNFPEGVFKMFGPIPGAAKPWPMTARKDK